jgi:hypothetical protein
MGSTFSNESSFGAFDFLVSFTFDGGTAPWTAWVKNAEMEESRTAIV